MLTLNYRYRIYPDIAQQQLLDEWMETCRLAYNYGLRQIKDWLSSRKCLVDRNRRDVRKPTDFSRGLGRLSDFSRRHIS